jgi:hypothetical protein
MHFGTFQLTTEGIDEPIAALERARTAAGISAEEFGTLDSANPLECESSGSLDPDLTAAQSDSAHETPAAWSHASA